MLRINKTRNTDITDVLSHGSQIHRTRGGTETADQLASGKHGRRPPHKTTEDQKRILLAAFDCNPNPGKFEREHLARLLNVERRIIKNWFSNHRAMRRKVCLSCLPSHTTSISAPASESMDMMMNAQMERNIAMMTGTPLERHARERIIIPYHRSGTPHPYSSQNVLRITTNANSELNTPTNSQFSSKKLRETLTHPMRSPITISSFTPSTSPVSPVSRSPPMFLSPCSWSPMPSNDTRTHPILDRPSLREEGSKTSSLPINGYPESALRTSLTIEESEETQAQHFH